MEQKNPILEYLPEDYEIIEHINVFASGKDGIFTPGTPIGKTNDDGEVELFVDPNQLSFVTVNLNIQNKGKFVMAKISIINKIYNSGPLILLYYLCISEVDTNLEKIFEIFTLNFQIILIYFWVFKKTRYNG